MLLPENTNSITGNLVFDETVRMEIDPTASGIILDSLIRIYANPYIAALREYSSNAWDSHRAAGTKRPIEISLPTQLAPVLVVQDFGLGMDRAELAQYGQFGFSTKRATNDQIGGFGLGSKVGLAFSAQYTVEAIKDGKKNVAVIGRDKDGNPQMGLLAEKDTDLPNGVKVSIPTNEYYQFREAMNASFFVGYGVDAVLIDGKKANVSVDDPEHFILLEKGLGWRRKKGTNHRVGGIALVSGVKYTIDWGKVTNNMPEVSWDMRRSEFLNELVIDLPNGEVEITRSREDLVYSKRTTDVLRAKLLQIINYATDAWADDIKAAKNIREALILREEATSFGFSSDKYEFGGKVIDWTYQDKHQHNDDVFTQTSIRYGGNSNNGLTSSKTPTTYGQLMNNEPYHIIRHKSVLIVGCDPVKDSKGKTVHSESFGATQWVDQQEGSSNAFRLYFTSGNIKDYSKWFVGAFDQVITAADYMDAVTAVRKANAQRAAANRKANAAVNKTTHPVRRITLSSEGRSDVLEMDAADLDPTKTHILLKLDPTSATEQSLGNRLALTLTRVSYYGNSDDFTIMKYLVQNKEVVFLYATSTVSTKKYGDFVPNFLEADALGGLLDQVAVELSTPKSDLEKRAMHDRQSGGYDWAKGMPQDRIDQIKNDTTKQWATLLKINDSEKNTLLGLISRRATVYGASPVTVADNKPEMASPGKLYSLLGDLNLYRVDWDLVLDYINMLDASKGRI